MADTRKNTYGAGHILREQLQSGILDAHHCNKITVQEIGIPFYIYFRTVASTTNKDVLIPKGVTLRLLRAHGFMIGAGASSDTLKLQKLTSAAVASDITETLNVSAKGDKATFVFAEIDNAAYELDGTDGDSLRLVQASDALAEVYAECIRVA